MNLYIDEKGNYKEVADLTHYIRKDGKGGLYSYTKETLTKEVSDALTIDGYRKAKKEEVESKFAFTKEKLKEAGYREANEKEVKDFYSKKTKIQKVESPDQSNSKSEKEK